MISKKSKPILEGTLRIKSKDLNVYEKTKTSWKRSSVKFPEALHVIHLFKAHDKLDILIDKKNPEFFKGQLSPDGKVQGARINILPDGSVLDKAYSLFAKHLTVHDEASNDHWDVLCQNPGGTYSYAYTLKKKNNAIKKKYSSVKEFEKYYPKLEHKVLSALKDENDCIALPMYTLLKTYMRIGNEIYYKAHGHKGLTTLKKKDISINESGVTFKYLAKNGVPMSITEKFPDTYINRLKSLLRIKKNSEFVFTNPVTGHPLSDVHFKKAFKKYCGKEFYPHIVRSYYATKKAEEFLNKSGSATKEEIHKLFANIAEKLGHKRFVKKDHAWKENCNMTIHYYVQPELIKKIKSLTE